MLIEEIIRENNLLDVIAEIQTQLARAMSQDISDISTQEFLDLIHQQGYTWVSMDQLIELVDQSGYASSVSRDSIVPNGNLGDDVPQDDPADIEAEVGSMADQEAMKGIGDDL